MAPPYGGCVESKPHAHRCMKNWYVHVKTYTFTDAKKSEIRIFKHARVSGKHRGKHEKEKNNKRVLSSV